MQSLSFALRFNNRDRVHDADETTARITAERLIEHLERSGCTIFNGSQIDGPPAKYYAIPEFKVMEHPQRLIEADTFARDAGAPVIEEGYQAAYSPTRDVIMTPPRESFQDRDSFYSVTLHELTHWTGAKSCRDMVQIANKASDEYACEELAAGIGSAFLGEFRLFNGQGRSNGAAVPPHDKGWRPKWI